MATDLYLPAHAPLPTLPGSTARASEPSGLAHLARFGTPRALRARGWRAWLAARLGHDALAALAPASVAAAAGPAEPSAGEAVPRFAWIATPVHLIATLTSVYLDPLGLLRLAPAERAELVRAFNENFAALGWRLVATRAGALIASGPAPDGAVETSEPERLLGASVAAALPRGPGAGPLRRLGSEIEMWLHGLPLNAARVRAGVPPLSTLWLWGGGPLAAASAASSRSAPDTAPARAVLFSDDAYVEGLAHATATSWQPAPRSLAAVPVGAPSTLVAVPALQAEAAPPESGALPAQAHELEAFDRVWIAPAIERLARGELTRLAVVANDRCAHLTARDRWKLWRRPARTALLAWR